MSYPDVVKSSRNRSPQRPVVNVTQRSQVSSAALIESDAGIPRGHVNTIASLFGQKQSPSSDSTARRVPSNRGRANVRSNNGPANSTGARLSRIPVVPRETSAYHAQTHATQSSARSAGESSPKLTATANPVPWPKPAVGQLKSVKSSGKSDSNLHASSVEAESSEVRRSNESTQPTIVFNKTKYVPRSAQSADRANRSDKTESSETPSAVRVGRWSVYETLPFKDGSGLSRDRVDSRQHEREAQQKREEEEWRKREALERERIAEAERRKEEYDRKHREELEAQERRHREELAAEERRRREVLEREQRDEARRGAEEEKVRRRELEERDKRHREAAEREKELERMREFERQDNERKLQEAREKRRLEMEQEEDERRQRTERRRHAEREDYERKMQDDYERRRWEERLNEEEVRKRMEDEKRMRDSTPDVYTADEWTVVEKVPLSSAEVPGIGSARNRSSGSPSYVQGSSSAVGYRRLLDNDGRRGTDELENGSESEYMRNLREIESNRRRQEEETRRQGRDVERQRMQPRQEEDVKRRDKETRSRRADEKRFQDGMDQWSALTEAEPIASGSAVGYRRFLDDSANNGSHRTTEESAEEDRRRQSSVRGRQEDERRRREEDEARSRREAEEETRRRVLEQDRRRRLEVDGKRREEELRRRGLEEEQHRRGTEDRRRRELEEDKRRREEEMRRQEMDKELRRRELEENNRRREDEERRIRQRETRWSNYDNENRSSRRGRFGGAGEDPDIFSRDEWTVFESAPVRDASASHSAMHRSPSQESIVGYRRLLGENARLPDSGNNSRSRSHETKTRLSFRIGDDDRTGGRHRTETSTRYGQSEALPKNRQSDEDTPHFEEWTEYHSVPAQFQAPGASTSTARRYDHRRAKERRLGNGDSDESAPKFEEWTVVHKVPTSQSQAASAAYDVTDADDAAKGNGRSGSSNYGWNDRGNEMHSSDDGRQRRQSAESSSLIDSGENLAVEDIMPMRRDTGKRHHDALVEAALRQLDAAPNNDQTSGDATTRLSPYHSYQRIHNRGQHQGDYYATDNGNVFQESFNVRRDNPAYLFPG